MVAERGSDSPGEGGLPTKGWNRTEKDFPGLACLDVMFEAQARKDPEAAAVSFGGKKLSYRGLDQKANQLAYHLKAYGIEADVPVGICLERSLDLPVAVLAVLKAGGAYLPLDPEYPLDRLEFMLEDAKAPVLITQESLAGIFASSKTRTLILEHVRGELEKESTDRPKRREDLESLAYVIYTSGSTGRPKGVAMGHRPLANLTAWQLENSQAGPGTRTLQFTPLSFDVSCQELFATWCSGGELVLITDRMRLDAANCLKFIDKEKIGRIFLPFVAPAAFGRGGRWSGSFPRVVCRKSSPPGSSF